MSGSREPLLGHTSPAAGARRNLNRINRTKNRYGGGGGGGGALLFLNIFRGGLVAPSSTTYDSMYIILNTRDPAERDELTRNWMDHKLEELNFVGVVGGLLSGCLTSTGAWPDVLDNGQDKPWIVKAFWYSGIVFAVFAVLTAAQQGLRLHRLAAHRDGLKLIRRSMAEHGYCPEDDYDPDDDAYEGAAERAEGGGGRGGEATTRPRTLQIYAWQASLTFLVGAVVALIVGILILVWFSAAYGPEKRPEDGWWDGTSGVAVVFTLVTALSTAVFFTVQTALATGIRDER